MLADAPSFGDVAATLLARLAGTTLVAHNAPFDVKFLIAEMARVGLEWPSPPVMCTLEGARHRMPGESSYKLGSLAKKCGISLDNAHSALDDTVACAELFIRLMKDTPDLLVDDPMAVSWPWVSPENAHPGSARPAPALV
jgi:DNA polymerase-3 subunit epsilon